MDSPAVFPASARERRAVADLLDSLDGRQLATPSRCTGWDVRTVAAHLAATLALSWVPLLAAELSPEQRAERGDYVGCLAGALSFSGYRHGLEAAGFTDVEITPTHAVASSVHAAIMRATKPPSSP